MTSQPTEMVSRVKLAPTGVDEQAGILLTNAEGEMAAVTLSLHAKQPKRGTISYDKGLYRTLRYHVGKGSHHLYRRWLTRSHRGRRNRQKPSSMRS